MPGSKCQRVVEATKPFDLVYVETDNVCSEHTPVFQLVRKLISNDPKTQRTWVDLIRRLCGGYRAGYHTLQIDKQWINCMGCKSQMHSVHGCPLPKVEGWLGIKPDNAQHHTARLQKQKEGDTAFGKGRGGGRGGNRGSRGGGHSGGG